MRGRECLRHQAMHARSNTVPQLGGCSGQGFHKYCRLAHEVDHACDETDKLLSSAAGSHENDVSVADTVAHANHVLAMVDAELEADAVRPCTLLSRR